MISDYTEGMLNARVYKTAKNNYMVVFWDGNTQEDFATIYETLEQAEDAAEDWVLKK